VSGCAKAVAGLGLGVLVAVLLVGWRLASGPVSIGFLTPYVQAALNDVQQGTFNVTVEDTILTWAGWQRTLDIRVVNVQVKSPHNGAVVATIPEVSVSLSVPALLKGVVAPRSIEFFGPTLKVQRYTDGRFAFGFEGAQQGSDDLVSGLLSVMLQKADSRRPLSYLQRINVVAGEITFQDQALGTTWHAPSADGQFVRTEEGLRAELDMNLRAGDQLSSVSIVGSYAVDLKRTDIGISFSDMTPSSFSDLSSQMNGLQAFDLPLSGTVTASINSDGGVEGVGFDLASASSGHLALPVQMASDIGALGWAQRMAVESLSVRGRYLGAGKRVDIDHFDIKPKAGESVYLPSPIDHNVSFDTLKTQFSYLGKSGAFDVKELTLELGKTFGGTEVSLFGSVSKTKDGSRDLNITGVAEKVRFDDLTKLWPKGIATDARKWVLSSLSKGVADKASLDAELQIDEKGAVNLKTLSGEMTAHGVDVRYIDTMPKVKDARGHATFNKDRFDITVESGQSDGGLSITAGKINLVKLQEDMQWAEIDLNIQGPIPAALKLIDSEPLGFASSLGIKPETGQGMAVSKISLRIPLKNDLLAKEVEATATAQLVDAGIEGVVFEKDISKGKLSLVVDANGLSVNGEAHLGDVPVEMKWNHDFRKNALFTDRYELSGHIENVLNISSLGIQVPEVLSRYMSGGTQVNVNYTELNNGRQSLSARIDLADVVLSAPQLGWSKPQGVPGTAALELRLNQGLPSEIPKFSISAPNMDIAGSASFLTNGKLERVDLQTLRSNLTDVAGSLTPLKSGAWEVVLRGESLDASVLWDELLGLKGNTPPTQETDKTASQDNHLVVNAAVDIHSLLVSKNHVIHDFIGSVYRDRGVWRKVDISGVVGKSGAVELMLDTAKDGLRYLSITSNDAGSTLKTLGLHDNILGGDFDLKAAYTKPHAVSPLEGVVKLRDYAMIEAPAFAKLIGVMSLTGILDALQGDGLNFDVLNLPFKLENGVLEMTQARASGPTIGVTASGKVDMANKILDLEGTVVPAYAINALLGKIPLIGKLFSGNEEGGGLFAATYTMKGQGKNVDITVNPLSVLAPGALRNIFTGTKKAKEMSKPTPMPAAPILRPVPVVPNLVPAPKP